MVARQDWEEDFTSIDDQYVIEDLKDRSQSCGAYAYLLLLLTNLKHISIVTKILGGKMVESFLDRVNRLREEKLSPETSPASQFEQATVIEKPDPEADLEYQKLQEIKNIVTPQLEGAPVQIFINGEIAPVDWSSSGRPHWQLLYGFHPRARYCTTYDSNRDSFQVARSVYKRHKHFLSLYSAGKTYKRDLTRSWDWDGDGLKNRFEVHGHTYLENAVEILLNIAAASYDMQQKMLWESRINIA